MKRTIAAYTKSPHSVHLDAQGRELIIKPRPHDTYRATRRNVAKVVRRKASE